MKKQLLFAVIALFSFAAGFSQPGTSCNTPIVIGSLPYQHMSNTELYGDTYDVLPGNLCGAVPATTNYFAGSDVFYSFTATASGSVTFTMTPESGYSGIFIYDGCQNVGVSCLAGFANSNATPRTLTISAVAGHQYIAAVSSSLNNQTVAYKLIVQQEDCAPRPQNLTATDITQTSAFLGWSSFNGSSSFEVAVQPAGSPVPSGPGTPTIIGNNSYTATFLQSGTQYQFWVRSECNTPGSGMFSAWAGPFLFNTLSCNPGNQCNYIFRMTDSASNGWNNARMQVKQNGIVVATIGSTYNSGAGPVDVTVPLCENVPFEVYWSVPGTQPQQCIVSVINAFGQTIYSKPAGSGTAGTAVYSGTTNCLTPLCSIAPTEIVASGITTTGASLSWNAPATNSWDIYVVTPGSDAPTAMTAPTYDNVSSNPFTTTISLLPDTAYTVYVRVNCAPQPSEWSQAYTFTTAQSCFKPLLLGVSNVQTTSAMLSWQNGSPSDTNWEILLASGPNPPVQPISESSGQLIPVNSSQLPFTANGLNPGTIYYYYIRTVCSASDKSNWSGPYVFNTVLCNAVDKCNYKFFPKASQDTWNGARMQVRQNGILIATLGASQINAAAGVTVALCTGVPFDIYWTIPGTTPEDIGLKVLNPFTDVVYTKNPGTGNPLEVLYSGVANCTPPSCPKPTAMTVTAISQTSATLGWTENGSAASWEIYVAPIGSPAPVNGSPVSGIAPYKIVNTSMTTINDLVPGTGYTYYVRAICSPTDVGTWTLLNPKTFYTKPLNDECANAIAVPVNPTREVVMSVAGTTIGGTASVPATFPACTGNANDDVWFTFTATSTVHIIKILNATATVYHTLYSGACGSMTQIRCFSSATSVANNLVIGQEYKIRVYTYNTGFAFANFDIAVTTPAAVPNDSCATPTPVGVNTDDGCGFSVSSSVTGATASPEGNTCTGTADDDVWFSFTAISAGVTIRFNNVSNSGLYHALYSGDCGNLVQLYCNTTALSAFTGLVPGQNYRIRVWSSSAIQQDITFDLCLNKTYPPVVGNGTQYTPQQLVQNILINNPCITVSNITSSTGTDFGATNGLGYFTNPGNVAFPIASGLVLSTGDVNHIGGPNTSTLGDGGMAWPGDTDVENIVFNGTGIAMQSHNATKLEFDFTTVTEYMSFNFLFTSEEYGVFQCAYSDAFAFLLTDLETNITTNIAVVPGTATPVSVVTIRDNFNNNECTSENPGFFDRMYYDSDLGAPTNFNGQTALMTASSAVLPNHPYHIKLAIADRGDSNFDSAVFIQAGSFAQGPPECTDKIELFAYVDSNGNNTKDTDEPDFTYGSFIYQKNNTGDPSNVSSPIGTYVVYDANPANTYDFSYAVNSEYSGYYSVAPTTFNDINIPAGSGTQTLYFPVTLTQAYNDVTVSIVPLTPPVPGSTYKNKIVYRNLGIAPASGTVSFTAAPSAAVTTVSEATTLFSTGGFTCNFASLQPYETRSIIVTMSVPAIPVVNIGDVLTNNATISAPSNDINLANNAYANSQIAVASYDPNDKTEAHGEKIAANEFNQDDYLFYTIRFQNTGTANATSVRLEDLLDAQLDETSIRMVSASHNYIMERIDNKVVWKFDYIQLPAALENEEHSKGYVAFKIRLKPGFSVGDIVPNGAQIYFDTNPAIQTNVFQTEFVTTLGNPEFNGANLMIFPNPANTTVQVSLQNTSESIEAVSIYDILGKRVKNLTAVRARQAAVDVSSLSQGVYMIEVLTDNKFREIKKLIIQ